MNVCGQGWVAKDGCGHGWRVWLIEGDVVMGVGDGRFGGGHWRSMVGMGDCQGMGDGQGMGVVRNDCGQ